MTGSGGLVEVQGTAEGRPFTPGAIGRPCSTWPPGASPAWSRRSARPGGGMSLPRRLVAATKNPDKAREVAAVLAVVAPGVELVGGARLARRRGVRRHPRGERPAQGAGGGRGHRPARPGRRHRPGGRRPGRGSRGAHRSLRRARCRVRRQPPGPAGRPGGGGRPPGPLPHRGGPGGPRAGERCWPRGCSKGASPRRSGAAGASATTPSSRSRARPWPKWARTTRTASATAPGALAALAADAAAAPRDPASSRCAGSAVTSPAPMPRRTPALAGRRSGGRRRRRPRQRLGGLGSHPDRARRPGRGGHPRPGHRRLRCLRRDPRPLPLRLGRRHRQRLPRRGAIRGGRRSTPTPTRAPTPVRSG